MRIAYLGPEGTFSQAAALTAPAAAGAELVALPTIFDAVAAVRDGSVERAVVPIENSQEGSVSATLDALALDGPSVTIVGEVVLPIEQCLIAQDELDLSDVEVVISHPQATGQCSSFIREALPQAKVITASSTAEAVRLVSERIRHRWAAIGTRLAAEIYGCTVLRAGIEDRTGNETRFIWLGPEGAGPGAPGAEALPGGRWKTSLVFWGAGTGSPGWLVGCLAELSQRGVNLTRIESRPRKRILGEYMFFADCDGRATDPEMAAALAGLREHVEVLRVLGSFPAQ